MGKLVLAQVIVTQFSHRSQVENNIKHTLLVKQQNVYTCGSC